MKRSPGFKPLLSSAPLCRYAAGSNKVLQVALGKGPEDEQKDGIHQLSALIKGHAGLVFTNLTKEDLEASFEKYRVSDYARCGGCTS
jgi:mRNA turnover protein 4